jgi:PAS domain S-box-containing protein
MEVTPVFDHRSGAETHVASFELKVPMTPTDPELYKELLDLMSDGICVADRDRRFLYCNQAALRITGYKAEDITGRSCQDLEHCPIGSMGQGLCQDSCHMSECMRDGGTRVAEAFLRHKQGWRIPVAFRVQLIRAADGSIIGAVAIFKDDSARHEVRRKTEAMERLAFLDSLTQTPNRRFLEMSMHTAMREYQVTNVPFGVLVI